MDKNDKQIIKMYEKEKKSTYQIAKQLGTYAKKIERILKKYEVPLRTRSEAQKAALETGTSKHPTEGKKRSDEEKLKISSGLVKFWEEMPDEEYERRVDLCKENWNNMTDEQKETMRAKGIAAIRAAANKGSKLEQLFKDRIEEAGYFVRQHVLIIPSEKLEIDLYIPELKTIIEVDGPSHFIPIWGEEKLAKQINADLRKSGSLLTKGYVVIRVKSLGQESLAKKEQMVSSVLESLHKISNKFPKSMSKRFIEVE